MINKDYPKSNFKYQGLKRILNSIIESKIYDNFRQRRSRTDNVRNVEFIFLNDDELDIDTDKLQIQIISKKNENQYIN